MVMQVKCKGYYYQAAPADNVICGLLGDFNDYLCFVGCNWSIKQSLTSLSSVENLGTDFSPFEQNEFCSTEWRTGW